MRTTLPFLLVLLVAAGCAGEPDGRGAPAPASSASSEIPGPGGSFTIPARVESIPPVRVEVIARGDGLQARDGDIVAVHYTGRLPDGKVFDSSRGDTPFEFTLGQGQAIRGWDLTVARMRVGDRWVATIPPQLAYDQRGYPPVIPPNATLIFDMELVRVR